MIPLYGFLEGDTLGLLVLAEPGDTAAALAERLLASARVRVAARRGMRLQWKGRLVEPKATLEELGITALDRFDVVGGMEVVG